MKSTKHQLLEADFKSLQRDLKMHKEMIEQLRKENKGLRSLSLWSIRRLHKTHKDFAYGDYERITGEKAERL
ncbi:hypothetical protein [Cytobacillus oceanisediminis]|uniref:hypothetical protein n=1 Tax=Cytobacillus oceanisediminis TaxID=665099 RepID=UPI003734C494